MLNRLSSFPFLVSWLLLLAILPDDVREEEKKRDEELMVNVLAMSQSCSVKHCLLTDDVMLMSFLIYTQ